MDASDNSRKEKAARVLLKEQALDMEFRIRQEFRRWGLADWTFFWDRAKRRLGACWYSRRSISLSRYLLEGDGAELWNTLLHEIAHALAFINDNERGHGEHWKKWCRFLGIDPARCSDIPLLDDSNYRYALRRSDTGEIVGRYFRKPRFKYPMRRLMIKGHPETKGKLELIPFPHSTSIREIGEEENGQSLLNL